MPQTIGVKKANNEITREDQPRGVPSTSLLYSEGNPGGDHYEIKNVVLPPSYLDHCRVSFDLNLTADDETFKFVVKEFSTDEYLHRGCINLYLDRNWTQFGRSR